MAKWKVKDNQTGQEQIVEANSQEEAITKVSGVSQGGYPQAGGIERNFPFAASVVGGVAGPAGQAAGMAAGLGGQKVIQQMRMGGTDVLAQSKLGQLLMRTFTRGAQGPATKLTPYAQQKSQELGMPSGVQVKPELLKRFMQSGQKISNQPEFSYGQVAMQNIGSPESLKAGKDFQKEVAAKSAMTYIFSKAFEVGTKTAIEKVFPKISALFKVKGVTPKAISESASKAAGETWAPLQAGLSESTEVGVTQPVKPFIDKIVELRSKTIAGYTEEQVLAMPKDNAVRAAYEGFNNVIKQLTDLAGKTGELNPQQMQTIKSLFGLETYTIAGAPKVSTQIKLNKEIIGEQLTGGKLREQIVNTLEAFGVKDAGRIYNDWAKINNLKDLSNKGLAKLVTQNVFGATTLGAIGGSVANIALAVYNPIIGLATYLTLTPYGNQIAREIIKGTVKVIGKGAQRVGSPLLSDFLYGKATQNK